MAVTNAQKEMFFNNGYLNYGKLISDEQAKELQDAYFAVLDQMRAEQALTSSRQGQTSDGTLANTSDTHRRALAIHFMDAAAKPLGDGRQHEPAENMPVVRGQGVSW